MAAVGRTSAQSLYRRFFAPRRDFTEKETSFFLNVDFVDHVALIATVKENGRPLIVGGGRYVVVQPGQAELAFTVIDSYQGKGIGTALMRHLIAIARDAALRELIAQVLPNNAAMLRVLKNSGLHLTTRCEPRTTYVSLQLSD